MKNRPSGIRLAASVRRLRLVPPAVVLTALVAVWPAEAETRYVNVANSSPAAPYTSWSTAATNIQQAVDVATAGDEIVVTNGTYATGGRAVHGLMTNRVTLDKALTLRSVNGPQFTLIQGRQLPTTTNGDGAIRCVYLSEGASLSGFTLSKGATRTAGDSGYEQSGGGLFCDGTAWITNCLISANAAANSGGGAANGRLYNCALIGNAATNSGGGAYGSILYSCVVSNNATRRYGGGAYGAWLYNCTLNRNSADTGGGAANSTLNNCVLTTNSAATEGGGVGGGAFPNNPCTLTNCLLVGNSAVARGGGAVGGALYNCTLAGNSAPSGGGVAASLTMANAYNCIVYSNSPVNYWSGMYFPATFNSCCTTPLPGSGLGNFTAQPAWINPAAGNFRLQTNSPCLNTGSNLYAKAAVDLDSRPRIVNGTVDVGAYEFQGAGLGEFTAWLQQYGLPTDGSADYADTDGDHRNNWQEWRCGTNPTDALSVLCQFAPLLSGTNLILRWQGVAGVKYFLECGTDLAVSPTFGLLATNRLGQAGTNTYTHTNGAVAPVRFYRVGVSD